MKNPIGIALGVLLIALLVGITLRRAREPSLGEQKGVANPAAKEQLGVPVAASDLNNKPDENPTGADLSRRYSERPFLERNTFLKETRKMDLASVFKLWFEAGQIEHDILKQGDLASSLGNQFREKIPAPEFLDQVREFIADSSKSIHDRMQLLGVLSYAGTNESVVILLDAAVSLQEKELRQAAMSGIGRLDSGGITNDEVSATLNTAWRESRDQRLLAYIALAMAQSGAASSIDLLLDACMKEDQDALRAGAARGALSRATILNPDAVTPLATFLATQAPGNQSSRLATDTLAKMPIPAAAKALVNWLQDADENAAPLAARYVIQATTPAQMEAWELALNPSVPFRSERNREAVRAGLNQYRKSIQHEAGR